MVKEIAYAKHKLNFKKQNLFKKTSIKRIFSIVASKRLVIIRSLSQLIVCYATTILQKKLPNNPMGKHKIKITPIVHITNAINTLKCNVK